MRFGILLCSLALVATPSSSGELEGVGYCGTCHPAARVQWRGSVHAGESLACLDCHGGEPQAVEADIAHEGMLRFESESEVVSVCGGCHADASRMRPYRLRIDQRALYETSTHGRARLVGDERAPGCTDCHQHHLVLETANPASQVSAGRQPETCGGCHAQEESESAPFCGPGPDAFWSDPHGRRLRETAEDPEGPSCATCHDGHGAAVPLGRDVDEICGGCHAQVRSQLLAGPHWDLLQRDGNSGCASCHPVHDGLRARSPAAMCLDCHTDDSAQVARGGVFEKLMQVAEEEVEKADLSILEARRIPLDTRDHEALVRDARRSLDQARLRTHALRLEPVEDLTRTSRSLAIRVQDELESGRERRSARLALPFVWFFSLVTLAVLQRARRRQARGDEA